MYTTTSDYKPERLGGFGEGGVGFEYSGTIIDRILDWRLEPLGGFGDSPGLDIPSHTGHQKIYGIDELIAYIFPYDTKFLRENMAKDGRPVLPGRAAHHIVAGKHGSFDEARALLASKGIDINEAANGVSLNNERGRFDSHIRPGLHSRAAANRIIGRIRELSPDEARAELQKIGQEMKNGTW